MTQLDNPARNSYRSLYLVALIATILTIPWLGQKPFFTRGEPREALVAQYMFEHQAYVLPQGYGGVVPSKPPALHWLISLCSRLGGQVTEFSSRLPSALASLFLVCAFYLFLQRRVGRDKAFVSSLLLLSSLEWYRAATACRVDMLLACLFSGGLLALYRWYERDLRGIPVLAVLLLAGATLAKGPVAIVLPSGIFGLLLLLRGECFGRATGKSLLVFVPAALLALSWYWLAAHQGGQAFLDKVYYENVARFAGTMDDEPHNHSAPYLYGMLLLGFLPWTLVLGRALVAELPALWRRLRNARKAIVTAEPFCLFCSIAVVAVIVFFSIPSSKRGVYLLPLYPFAAALLGIFIVNRGAALDRSFRLAAQILAWLVLAISASVLALKVFSGSLHSKSPDIRFALDVLGNLQVSSFGSSAILLLLVIGLALANLRSKLAARFPSFECFVGLVFALLLAADSALFPPFCQALSSKNFALALQQRLSSSDQLYSFQNEFYGLSFDLHRRIDRLEESAPQAGVVFVYQEDLAALKQKLSEGYQWELIDTSAAGIIKPGRPVSALRFMKQLPG